MASMILDTKSPLPLYHQLQEIIRSDLEQEGWPVGKCLPSENKLCRKFGVTRPTVRQAVDGLVREGRVIRKRGRGTFVAEPRPPVGLMNLVGTSEALKKKQLRLTTQVLLQEETFHCPLLEKNEKQQPWVKLERLRRVNRIPVFFERTWVAAEAAPGLVDATLDNRSLYEYLQKEYGLQILGGGQRFHAVCAGNEISKVLKCKKKDPLLKIVRNLDLNGWPGGYRVELFIADGPFVPEEQIGEHEPFMK